MQLITSTATNPPVSFRADSVRDEQSKILHVIQPLTSEEVSTRTVRGQYGDGVINGQRVPAYRAEPGVPPDSRTETFVAMSFSIHNWRWADVPFYLRTGKRMAVRNTHIVIQFRRAPFVLFRDTPAENLMPNQLVLHIQPEEGISLRFAAKAPGRTCAGQRGHELRIRRRFRIATEHRLRTPAARLHDRRLTLFQRGHGRSRLVRSQPRARCVASPASQKLPNYASGTPGPRELMNYWSAMAAAGGNSNNDSR